LCHETNRDLGDRSLSFSRDGKSLVSGSCWKATVWDTATGQEKGSFGEVPKLYSGEPPVLASADGQRLVTVAVSHKGSNWLDKITVWDTATRQAVYAVEGPIEHLALSFAPDGRTLVLYESTNKDRGTRGKVRLFDVDGKKERPSIQNAGDVRDFVFSPDSSLLLCWHGGRFTLWDVSQRDSLPAFKGKHAIGVNPSLPQFSPHGRFLIVRSAGRRRRSFVTLTNPGGGAIKGVEAQLIFWDVASQTEAREVPSASIPVVSASGQTYAYLVPGRSGDPSRIVVADPATGQNRTVFDFMAKWGLMIALSPDGRWLALGKDDGSVEFRDLATSVDRTLAAAFSLDMVPPPGGRALEGGNAIIKGIQFSPDGRHLVVQGDQNLYWSSVWSVQDKRRLFDLADLSGDRPQTLEVWACAFTPDSAALAAIGHQRSGYASHVSHFILYDLRSGLPVISPAHNQTVFAGVAFSPDGKALVGPAVPVDVSMGANSPCRILLVDPARWTARGPLDGQFPPFALIKQFAFSPDSKFLAIGPTRGEVQVWEVETGKAKPTTAGRGGDTIAFVGPTTFVLVREDAASFYDVRSGQRMRTLEQLSHVHTKKMYSSAFAGNLDVFVTTGGNGDVLLRNLSDGSIRARLAGHQGRVEAAAFAPDGKWLATAGRDFKLKLWDLQSVVAGESSSKSALPQGNGK
jgi:WD40 repeat protein